MFPWRCTALPDAVTSGGASGGAFVRSSAIAGWPDSVAIVAGVLPSGFFASRLAPFSRRSFTVSGLFSAAAIMRGVHPLEITAFGSLPMASITEQMDVWPAWAAAKSIEDPEDLSESSNEASRFLQGSWLGFSRHPCEPQSVMTV